MGHGRRLSIGQSREHDATILPARPKHLPDFEHFSAYRQPWTREDAARMLDLRRVDAEDVRGDLLPLLRDLLGREVERHAADGEAAAAVRVHPERDDRRVAMQYLDLVDLVAEPVGHDLRP